MKQANIQKKTHNTLERSTLSILMADIEHPMSMYFQNILTFIKLNKYIELIIYLKYVQYCFLIVGKNTFFYVPAYPNRNRYLSYMIKKLHL